MIFLAYPSQMVLSKTVELHLSSDNFKNLQRNGSEEE